MLYYKEEKAKNLIQSAISHAIDLEEYSTVQKQEFQKDYWIQSLQLTQKHR